MHISDIVANSSGIHAGFIKPSRSGGTVATMDNNLKGDVVKPSAKNLITALGLGALGVAFAAGGIYVGETDDAPGAALLGLLLMIGLVTFAVRIARRKA